MAMLDLTSLTNTVDAVNESFFYRREITNPERVATAEWIASRQVHAKPSSQGQLRICCHSLAQRMALGAPSIIPTTEDRPL